MSVMYQVISSLRYGWRVKRRGAKRAVSVHPTQREAFVKARELAKKHVGEVVVHGVDASVKSWSSYGKEPYPRRKQSHLKK